MATFVVDRPALPSTTPVLTANTPTGGGTDLIPNDGRTMCVLDNTTGTTCSVVFASNVVCDQGSSHNLSIALTAGEKRIVPFLPKARFNNSSGQVSVTYTGTVTNLKILCATLPS